MKYAEFVRIIAVQVGNNYWRCKGCSEVLLVGWITKHARAKHPELYAKLTAALQAATPLPREDV